MRSKNITRRDFVKWSSLAGASLALGLPGSLAGAAEKKFPSEPIDIIVPFSVGGGTDIWLRTFSVALASKKSLRVPVNIRNLPGAASLRGTGTAYKAKPDGYTLVGFNPPSTPWSWYMHQPPFDLKKFKGVSVFVREPLVMIAHPDFKYPKYDELVTAYSNGQMKIMAGLGAGGIQHVAALLMKKRSGVQWDKFVHYKGTGDVIAAVFRKEIEVGLVTASSALDHVKDGKLKPIVLVGIEERIGSYPDVPTLTEFGQDPIKECVLRRSVFAPPDTPEDRRKVLEQAFIKAQDAGILKAHYESLSLQPAYGNGQEAEDAIRDALKVAQEINLKEVVRKKG